jgi:hypothetical protein
LLLDKSVIWTALDPRNSLSCRPAL